MSGPAEKNRNSQRKGRKSSADPVRRSASGSQSKHAIEDHRPIKLEYEDGFPVGYTVCDNRDIWQKLGEELLLKPRTLGTWVAMLSLPEDWKFNFQNLRDFLDMGRDVLRATLAELEAKGRLKRINVRGPDGTYELQRWVLRRGGTPSSSQPAPPPTENQAPVDTDARTASDGPTTENQAPVSADDWKSSAEPAPETQAPVSAAGTREANYEPVPEIRVQASADAWKTGNGPAPENQALVCVGARETGDGPAPESQAPVSARSSRAGVGISGAGISGPLLTTEVIPSTVVTTTPPPPLELVPPSSLPLNAAQAALSAVEKSVSNDGLCPDLAQPILDELEGAVRRGRHGKPIEKPISYLRSLLRRAQSGEFVPDAGLFVERERQRQAREAESSLDRARQRQRNLTVSNDPEARRRSSPYIAECNRILRIRPQSVPAPNGGSDSFAPHPQPQI